GAPDAAMLDAGGKLHVFANERSGRFIPWPAALPSERFLALAIGDADDDGTFDLLTLRDDGAILRIGDRNKRGAWKVGELGRWESLPAGAELGTIRLIAADLDSNGSTDVLASGFSGTAAWLGSAGGHYESLATPIPPNVFAVANLGCGHLDLLSLEIDPDKDQTDAQKKNHPIRHHVTGKRGYHGQTIRFRAERQQNIEAGDNRINSFGIGGEIEVRSGTHIVKQPITTPSVHIGLGERTRADLVRIQWPNGQFQVEFRVPADHTVSPLQRLKGSCPFLFTWNGEKFAFVTDTLWSSPLGLYINAQYRGGIAQTTEWVKVRGNQLVPRDGFYEARVQANLWESHFFDHLALQVIDHPPDTELFSDERFALEPMQPSFHMTELPRPVAKATDHFGNDATEAVRNVDGVYLDRSGRGRYQGITKEHWVEVDLGDDAPKTGPLWLMAQGWVHPTDSSVNFAIEQGKHDRPHGLILEVPDGHGGWKIVRDKIGFPAGKNKTAPIRLDGLEGPGVSRRFRLRTNMEIYWDALRIARGRDEAEIARTILLPVAADLQYRGILEMTQANPSSPELPDYDRIASRGQAWRDLIGFHTRFGDVRELLEKVDDRYVIMNAGDEIALKFAVPPGPRPGWKRDFIWVSDGWEKDGDFNTRFGKTVLPLPYHGMKSYDVPPGRLADDPVFRRFPRDWEKYHTRYVTPFGFERGLRPR
ncbi:MAG TPA: ASPIC/UnbV domain-containing protein, partial [Urbifossiella sp.]